MLLNCQCSVVTNVHIFDELSSIQVFAFDEVVGGHAVQAILSRDCRLSIVVTVRSFRR